MYFKRPSFRRGGSTGIGQLTPRTQARGGGNIGGGIIAGSDLGSRTGFSVLDIISGSMAEELTGGSNKISSKADALKKSNVGLKKGNIGSRLLTQLRNLSVPSASTTGLMTLPFVGPAAIAYANRPRTLAEKKVMQDYGPIDETFFQYDEYDADRKKARGVGEEISFTDALLMDPETGKYPRFFGRTEDRDPVSENVAAAMGQGIYVLPYQDHLAHMEVHLPFLKSPLFGSNPTITPVFLYPMALHLRDHLLNYYLAESHQAIDQAQRREIIGDDAEQEVEIILRVQKFIEEQLGGFGQELAQINQAAQQFKPEMASPGDEAMKIAELSAQMKQSELQQKAEKDTAQLQLNNIKLETNSRIQELKIAQTAEIEQAKLAASEADRVQRTELQSLRELAETERNNVRQMSETDRLNTREMNENKRKEEDLAARERMNASDNMTAKELAEMEIESGEKVAVSTGTGIDQNP